MTSETIQELYCVIAIDPFVSNEVMIVGNKRVNEMKKQIDREIEIRVKMKPKTRKMTAKIVKRTKAKPSPFFWP